MIVLDMKRSHTLLITIAIGVLNALVLAVIFGGVLTHPITMYRAESGDAQQTMWFMGWFWHAVLHGQNPFVTDMVNYPSSVNLMINASMPAEAIIFGPLIPLVSSAFAYNVMIFVNLCVTGIVTTLILMEFDVRTWLAMLGGIVMEVIPYTSAQMLGHANLDVTMWLFGALYIVIRVVRGKVQHPRTAGITLGLILSGEFYTSVEVFATMSLVLVLAFVVGFVGYKGAMLSQLRQVPIWSYVLFVLTCLVLIVPGLFFFKYGPNTPLGGLVPVAVNANGYVNDLVGFLVPSPVYLLSPGYFLHSPAILSGLRHLAYQGNFSEENGYIGVLGFALTVWAAYRLWRRKFSKVVLVLIVLIVMLSMGAHAHILGHATNIPLPWYVVAKLPLINEALPSRLMLYADILIVLLLFIAFEDVLSTSDEIRHSYNVVLAVLLLLITWLPTYQYPRSVTPASFTDIEPGGQLYTVLQGKPTLVLSDDFFQVMQAFVDGHYAFPVANVYAYQNDTASERAYRPFNLGWVNYLDEPELQTYVASMITETNVRKLLYQPTADTAIPETLSDVLTKLCGSPLVDEQTGAYVWTVPDRLDAIWVTGDIWNPEALFDTTHGQTQWAGPNWGVHTQGEKCVMTITAPSTRLLPHGVTLTLRGARNETVTLKPNQQISIPIDTNQSIEVHSASSFVPAEVLHNGDTRKLSVLIQLTETR